MDTASLPTYFLATQPAGCSTVSVCQFFFSGRNDVLPRKSDDLELVDTAASMVSGRGDCRLSAAECRGLSNPQPTPADQPSPRPPPSLRSPTFNLKADSWVRGILPSSLPSQVSMRW